MVAIPQDKINYHKVSKYTIVLIFKEFYPKNKNVSYYINRVSRAKGYYFNFKLCLLLSSLRYINNFRIYCTLNIVILLTLLLAYLWYTSIRISIVNDS